MFWGSGLYENLICSKIEKKVQVFFCYHRLSWFHIGLLYDNNANYGKMNLSIFNETLTPFLMIWMFFRAFYLFVCHNDFTTSTFCMTIYIKKSFFPGEYDYSTLCRYWSHCDSSRHSPNNIDFIEYQFLYMKKYAINSATAVVT